MTHDQNSKPELFCGTSLLWWIKMCNLYLTNVEYIIGAMMSRPSRALNLQIFSLSLCRTHLFAVLPRLLICHTVIRILPTNVSIILLTILEHLNNWWTGKQPRIGDYRWTTNRSIPWKRKLCWHQTDGQTDRRTLAPHGRTDENIMLAPHGRTDGQTNIMLAPHGRTIGQSNA